MSTAAEARTTSRSTARGWALPLLADLVCVLVFAIAGRGAHEAGSSPWVALAIAWPFAVGALVAHAALARSGRATDLVWPAGVAVLATTYAVGMALRVVTDRGTAVAFLVVAFLFLTATMFGWRAVRRVVTRRARRP